MIAKNSFEKLLKKGLTIGFAESMTGGGLCAELIKNSNASHVTPGGIIAYSIEQKVKLLHLDPLLIESLGVVSKEVAIEMARSIKKILNVDIGVSITGNAGPSTQHGTDQFEAYIGFSYQNDHTYIHVSLDQLTREEAIKKAIKSTYEQLEKMLEKIG